MNERLINTDSNSRACTGPVSSITVRYQNLAAIICVRAPVGDKIYGALLYCLGTVALKQSFGGGALAGAVSWLRK